MNINELVQPFLKLIEGKHALVARKLSLCIDQFQSASSIEQYQQIGILIRDAWIEFALKIFSEKVIPKGVEIPSTSDAKGMLQLTADSWSGCPTSLIKLSKLTIALANEIQHSRNINALLVKQCLITTIFSISMMIDLDAENNNLSDRRYYKCPICGSLNLNCEKGQEVDYDGPGPQYEKWFCDECDWEHFLYTE